MLRIKKWTGVIVLQIATTAVVSGLFYWAGTREFARPLKGEVYVDSVLQPTGIYVMKGGDVLVSVDSKWYRLVPETLTVTWVHNEFVTIFGRLHDFGSRGLSEDPPGIEPFTYDWHPRMTRTGAATIEFYDLEGGRVTIQWRG